MSLREKRSHLLINKQIATANEKFASQLLDKNYEINFKQTL